MSILIKNTTVEDLQRAMLFFMGHEIIELPDHGDLIDESETVEAQYYDDEHEEWSIKTKTVGDVLVEICEVPPKVVIPAERSEE